MCVCGVLLLPCSVALGRSVGQVCVQTKTFFAGRTPKQNSLCTTNSPQVRVHININYALRKPPFFFSFSLKKMVFAFSLSLSLSLSLSQQHHHQCDFIHLLTLLAQFTTFVAQPPERDEQEHCYHEHDQQRSCAHFSPWERESRQFRHAVRNLVHHFDFAFHLIFFPFSPPHL